MTDDMLVQARPGRSCPTFVLVLISATLAFAVCQDVNQFMDESFYGVYNRPDFFDRSASSATPEPSQAVSRHADRVAHETLAVSRTADGEAPRLQGANNGVIGPQGSDATVIEGVNTAGTIRVSNLANLEALLNLINRGAQFVAASLAMFVASEAIRKGRFRKLSKARALFLSGAVLSVALVLPTIGNVFVAFARHLNLFC